MKNNSQLSTFNFQLEKGFTLIELLIYITLVSIFITGAIVFTWDAIYGREKAYQQQIVEQNARIALVRIGYEIRRAQDINNITDIPPSLELENGINDTTISLSSGAIQITTEGVKPYNLTSNQVEVTGLSFTDLGSADENSKNVFVAVAIRQAQTAISGPFKAETTMNESIELNSQFNQARSLLVDGTGAILSISEGEIEGISLTNTGSADVVIDQLTLSWEGTAGGENITEVQIGGGLVEWSGTEGSGATLDLSYYTLTTAVGTIGIDYLEFDSSMSGATIYLEFIQADGSGAKATISVSE